MNSIVVAKIFIFNQNDKFLALRRSKTDDRRPLEWDIPGGWADEGEDGITAVVREAKEEAGLTLQPKNIQLIFTKNAIKKPNDDPLNVTWLFFVGRTKESKVTLGYEHSEAHWMTIDEALSEFKYDIQLDALKHIYENDLLPPKSV